MRIDRIEKWGQISGAGLVWARPGVRPSALAEPAASPREHLRRGHIRRLEDGRKFWINAAVVAAGNGGKIHKDYGIRRAA